MEAKVKIERVTKNTVVRQVMDQIKNQIATGQLVPGDKIPTEPQLAEQFGTGRSTIREAIKIFEYLGIIESHTRTGTYICDYSNISTEALTWAILLGKNEIYELVDLRRVIELRAIEIIIDKAKSDQVFLESIIESLEVEIRSMEEAVQNKDLEKLIDADYNIHGIIIEASDNNVYSNIYQTLKSFMHEEIKKTHKNNPPLSSSVDGHREIIDAIRNKDHAAAVRAFKIHIDSTIEQLS